MKKKILLDKVTSDKRLVVTYDQYNWIVKFGSANWNTATFRRKADHWYFMNFESLLSKIYRLMLRYNMRSLDYGDVLEAISETERQIAEIGKELDKKLGVQDGCR
jgi:hypothetical protein